MTSGSRDSAQTAKPATKRAIGYIRVSEMNGRAGPELHTVEVQQSAIEDVCRKNGYELIDVLTDLNRSGGDRNRPQFRLAMDRVLGGEADAIAVWKLSRFSRDWAQAGADSGLLHAAGKDLLAGDATFDTTQPAGRLMVRQMFNMAAWELDVLKEQWDVIKARVVERGSYLARAPFGYRRGDLGILEPDPADAPIVKELFRRRLAGESPSDLARWLDKVRPRQISLWDAKAVRRILANRAYLGESSYGQIVNPAAHDPLVEKRTWRDVGELPDDRQRAGIPRLRPYPLSGLLRCGSCGGPMSGGTSKDRAGTIRGNYLCSRRANKSVCSAPVSVSAAVAEKFVLQKLDELMRSTMVVADEDTAQLAEILERLDQADAALKELGTLDSRASLGDDWIPMIKQLRREKEGIEAEYAKATTAGIADVVGSWEEMDHDQRLRSAESAIRGVVVGPRIPGKGPEARLTVVWIDAPDVAAGLGA